MRYILTYIDKQYIDTIFIVDMIIGFPLLILLAIPFIIDIEGAIPLLVIIGFLWLISFLIPFFVYTKTTTYFFTSICIFMILGRTIAVFINIGYWCSHV